MENQSRLHQFVLLTWLCYVILSAAQTLFWSTDYVGQDNDDVMRLVQIRDFINGQSWFDLTQYRLGFVDGTLLHWSRLIDLPIAALIIAFSMFLSLQMAEAIALFIWPTLLILPTIYGVSRAGNILSPKYGGSIGAFFGAAYIYGTSKFVPGAIDHHNVQIALFANILPILIAKTPSWKAYGLAGLLSALAIAIGAETTPLIAFICIIVAVDWATYGGKPYRRPTRVFALAFSISLTLIFFLTTAPNAYLVVVCDALSFGYYSLGVAGAAGLFIAAALLSYRSKAERFASLGLIAAVVFLLAFLIAPQCMQSPLADLDPVLNELWLKNVQEAKSLLAVTSETPSSVPGFYFVPIIAIVICTKAIYMNVHRHAHIKIFVLLSLALVISLVQVRGSIFSNLIAIMPLIAWVSTLRARYIDDRGDRKAAFSFVVAAVISLPISWMVMAALVQTNFGDTSQNPNVRPASATLACVEKDSFTPLLSHPESLVATSSNVGASILRYTHHRTLSAPYHRNQEGMLAEIKLAMAKPDDARELARDLGIKFLIFCPDGAQTHLMQIQAPKGLYSQLADGNIPTFLVPFAKNTSGTGQIYRFN